MLSNDTKIVGRHGQYDIHKITILNPTPSKRLKLGVVVRPREWISKDLHASFPNSSEYAYVHEVKAGSLADEAGLLPQDILCSYSGGGDNEPMGFFHDLLVQGGNSNSTSSEDENGPSWKLITRTNFELLVGRAEYEQQFSFYVARKTLTLDSKPSELKLGVTLSWDITERARSYNSLSTDQRKILLEDAKANARLFFETERDEILDDLPESVKAMFGQIGFAQWNKNARSRNFLPVLILNPYDAPPGLARQTWLQKYQVRKEKSTLDKMNYLVYWYGETLSNDSDDGCFSIISQDCFLPWTEAKKQSLHKIPKKGYQKKILALKQINEASRLPASSRNQIIPLVLEFHDLLCDADLAQYDVAPPPPPTSASMTVEAPLAEHPSKRRRISFASSRSTGEAARKKEEAAAEESLSQSPHARLRTSPRTTRASMLLPVAKNDAAPTRVTRATASLIADVASTRITRASTPVEKTVAKPAVVVEPVPLVFKKPSAQISPLLRRRTDSSSKKRPTIPVTKFSTPVSSSSENDDSASSTMEDAEDRKPAAKISRHSRNTGAVQSTLDSFCQQIQGISRLNAVLKAENKQLQSSAKAWKEQYNNLADAMGKKQLTCCSIPDQIEDVIFQGNFDEDESHLEDMHVFLGKVAKQNDTLERENARLEAESGEWQAKVQSLVDELKPSLRK